MRGRGRVVTRLAGLLLDGNYLIYKLITNRAGAAQAIGGWRLKIIVSGSGRGRAKNSTVPI